MENIISEYYNKFVVENPVLYVCNNGINEPLSDSERIVTLEEWATNTVNDLFNRIRNDRNSLLVKSDWTQVPDAPVDSVAWAEYRQLLRDFPETITTIEALENPVWPTPPA